MMLLLTPRHFKDYELIDSGRFEKLERFGAYVLARPEPQAVWDKNLSEQEWERTAHAIFKRSQNNPEKGSWQLKKNMPERWITTYETPHYSLKLKTALSAFKHVGIFPEQAVNWDFIFERTKALGGKPRVLNLFAYTGAASLAANAAGAEVVHVDSVKQVITWARENMELSGLSGIRWMAEDALKFVKREVRRGSVYQGIILDPPAYGRGPDGEKWVLEDHINELLKLCKQLLDPIHHFFVINLYSLSFSALILDNLMNSVFGRISNAEYGELYLEDRSEIKLPLGVFYRF